jgi:hypothetical protein
MGRELRMPGRPLERVTVRGEVGVSGFMVGRDWIVNRGKRGLRGKGEKNFEHGLEQGF